MDSMQLNAALGEKLLLAFPDLKVDVHHPDITLCVEIRENVTIYSTDQQGAGSSGSVTHGRAMRMELNGLYSTMAPRPWGHASWDKRAGNAAVVRRD